MSQVAFNLQGDDQVNLDGSALLAKIASDFSAALSAYAAAAGTGATTALTQAGIATAAASIVQTFSTLLVASPDTVGIPLLLAGAGPTARQLMRLDRYLRLEVAGGLGPVTTRALGLDPATGYASVRYPLIHDGKVKYAELVGGMLELYAFGPKTQALLRTIARTPDGVTALRQTSGSRLSKSRVAIGHLSRATVKTRRFHYLLGGHSWIERTPFSQGVLDDFRGRGLPVVATGWMSLTNIQLGDGVQSAALTIAGMTVVNINGGDDGGAWSPEGLRGTMAAGDTTQGTSITWKGKTLSIYHRANGAAFSHATDGAAAQAVILGTNGAPNKTVIIAAAEGWHTTVLSRPSPDVVFEWYGAFAASALVGLTLSKMGNGGTKMTDWSLTCAAATGAFILADIAPDLVQITLIGNDAIASADPNAVAVAFRGIVAALRAARPGVEAFLGIPPQNGVAGITQGRLFADYVPGLLAACDDLGVDMINHGPDWPPVADIPYVYLDDLRHLLPEGGAGAMLAATQRRAFWETL